MDKNGINKQNELNNKAYIHDNPSFVNDDIELDTIQGKNIILYYLKANI